MSVFPCAYSIHLSVQSIQSGQYILLELRDNVHENPSELALLDWETPIGCNAWHSEFPAAQKPLWNSHHVRFAPRLEPRTAPHTPNICSGIMSGMFQSWLYEIQKEPTEATLSWSETKVPETS